MDLIFFNFSEAKVKAKKELLNLLAPVTEGRITNLRNEEIFQILQLCEWLHANLKKPSYDMRECELTIFKFMILFYDSLAKRFSTIKIRGHLEEFFEFTKKRVLGS